VHSKTACKPGGSVNLNIPKLYRSRWVRKPGGGSNGAAHFGVDVGAQTTANDSGNILWKPEWVWRSTEDMKHDCVGCVWIWEKKNEIVQPDLIGGQNPYPTKSNQTSLFRKVHD